VTRQKFFRGPQVERPWRKRLAKWCGLQETNSQHGRKYDAGFLYAYVKKAEKIRRVMMSKMTTIRKSKTHIINNDKQDSFQFVSV